ncbi:MAG: ferric reductase-like transmembrane domain-containing protein [Acidisphaera sp.]|nr:ferric reductase-like transmembrane domain-containing protein [Acidisphaera sp.]
MSLGVLWRDRRGRFSALKAGVLLGTLLPAATLAVQWQADALGGRPVHALLLGAGLWTVRFLMITLAVRPARILLDQPRLALVSRMLGVTTAAYALAHLSLYAVDQNLMLLHVAAEIIHRFYLAIGFGTLTGLLVLAATSTDRWAMRLGRGWKRLHRLIYLLGATALFHFFLQSKSDVGQAVLMAGFFSWLVLWRALPARLATNLFVLAALAPLAALATAGIEALWYAAATHLNWHRVLAANLVFDLGFGLRPSAWVGLAGLGVALLTALRMGIDRLRPGKRRRRPTLRPAGSSQAA